MKLERVAIVDVETTGLDREKDKIIELAAVLVDVEHGEVIGASSWLSYAAENAAEGVNQIPASLLRKMQLGMRDSVTSASQIFQLADALVAHRASFDRAFVEPLLVGSERKPWICSKFGIDWPRGRYGSHLTDLALAHGVPVTSNHRALDDCMLLARVMKEANWFWRDGEWAGLGDQLVRGIERGVGEPNRCRWPWKLMACIDVFDHWCSKEDAPDAWKDPCGAWVRSYRSDIFHCPKHGGPEEWLT